MSTVEVSRCRRFKIYEGLMAINLLLAMTSSYLLLQTVFKDDVDLSLPALVLHCISFVGELLLSTALVKWLLGFGDSAVENYTHGTKTYSLWILWGAATVILYVAIVTNHDVELALIALIGYFVSFMIVGYWSVGFWSLCVDRDFVLAIMFIYSYMTLETMANLYYIATREKLILLGLASGGIVISLMCQAIMAIVKMKRRHSWSWIDFSYLAKVMWGCDFIAITILALIQLIYVLTTDKYVPPRLLASWQMTISFIIMQSIVVLSLAVVALTMLGFLVLRRWLRRRYYLLSTDIEI